MTHPTNLSDEYPCQGDTWHKHDAAIFTVVLVTPKGKIRYINLESGNREVKETDLDGFKAFNLGKPSTCTSLFINAYGVNVAGE